MRQLNPLSNIHVPTARGDQSYRVERFGRPFEFANLKILLSCADIPKSGDRNAGLSAKTEAEREAARFVLSNLTLQEIYDTPLTTRDGKIDEIMRVNYDIDRVEFEKIRKMKLGAFKNFLLEASGGEVSKCGFGLTGVMAAAVAKICDTHELIYIAKKISRPTKARTTLGLPKSLSSRCQPNHPVDDLRGISFLTYLGLSLASGDALIGMNPAIDTVDNVTAILKRLDSIRRKTGAPTQICVLAHVKTQMAALERGAPVEIMFQSLAGTESTLLTEFDVSVDLLDRAYMQMQAAGPIRDAKQFMYFETGQGSEFTYGKHEEIDMATLEACCYGLARRYDPFMVNNVTGFIGPETHLDNFEMIYSCLQDHFMGKLLGVPMGMAPCYTLHANITLEGQQMATQMLTAAGANFYMDVAFNTDRMLAYFDTSGHDNQTLREIYGKSLTPEFQKWAIEKQIMALTDDGALVRGKNWGKPELLCESEAEFEEYKNFTPALFDLRVAGSRPVNEATREMRFHQGASRDAIYGEIDLNQLKSIGDITLVKTRANSKLEHLNSPALGSFFSDHERSKLSARHKSNVQVLISDGLSADAIHKNVAEFIPVFSDGMKARRVQVDPVVVAPYGRVKLAEDLATVTNCELIVLLIGERPGGDAQASTSMSAYLVYHLRDAEAQRRAAEFSGNRQIRFEYTVVSNIYPNGGLPPLEAGSVIAEKVTQILERKAAGNRLESMKN